MRALCLTFLACALVPASLAAQRGPTDRGSILVGGSASLGKSETEVEGQAETSTTFFRVQPEAHFFFADRVGIGGRLSFGHSSGDNVRSSSWGIGPSVRYFLSRNSRGALPFIGGSVNFETGDTEFDGTTTPESEFESKGYEGVIGVTWMLSRQVGLTGEAFARQDEITTKIDGAPDHKATDTNLGVRFGFAAFIFGGRDR
jgi:hypothetical protein